MNKELQQAYKDYIKILCEDLNNHATISGIHGCQTDPKLVVEGARLRNLIEKLEIEEEKKII